MENQFIANQMFQRAKINGKGQGRAYKMYDHVRMLSAQNESGEFSLVCECVCFVLK